MDYVRRFLSSEMHLRFLCAHDYLPVEHAPIVIREPTPFMRTAGPAVLMGLSALKLALAAGRVVSGLKLDELLPALGEEGDVGAALGRLEELKEGIDKQYRECLGQDDDDDEAADAADDLQQAIESLGAEDLDEEATQCISRVQELTGRAYQEVLRLAKEQRILPDKLPMQRMVDVEGNVAWVSAKNLTAWKKQHRGRFGVPGAKARAKAALKGQTVSGAAAPSSGSAGTDGSAHCGGGWARLSRCFGP